MTDLFNFTAPETLLKPQKAEDDLSRLVLYHLVPQTVQQLGLTSDSTLCFGYAIELRYRGEQAHDLLGEELANGWQGDCLDRILLPEEGLVLGRVYSAKMTHPYRDWETGALEDWDIQLVPYTGTVPEGRGCADEVGEADDEGDV